MNIKRSIDSIAYCTNCETFFGSASKMKFPLVLNWLITNKCNLECKYCFASDINNRDTTPDFVISYINSAPFLKLVISGGEPFQNRDIWNILSKINHHQKAIVIDTNGLYDFRKDEIDLLIEKKITLRISIDSVNPNENEKIRHSNKGTYFERIIDNIELLSKRNKVSVALQTVVTKLNIKSLINLSDMISHWKVKKWYLQPIIPSGRGQFMENLVPAPKSIKNECSKLGLDEKMFLLKEDENQKSVVLLNNYGELITEELNNNIEIGNITMIDNKTLINRIDKENHIKRYKIFNKCLCEKV